jgi:hypothetical protein
LEADWARSAALSICLGVALGGQRRRGGVGDVFLTGPRVPITGFASTSTERKVIQKEDKSPAKANYFWRKSFPIGSNKILYISNIQD